jgi:hypothetical protein
MYRNGICNTGRKFKVYLGGSPIRPASAVHPFTAKPLSRREERRVNPATGVPFRETGELVRAS